MKRILFVDDEPKVLDGLKRMLYSYRKDWDMVFVSSGEQALQQLSQDHFDVLITDMRMPGMNGIDLLTQVVQRHPQVVRMVLSGTADTEITLSSVTLAHQYLAKPCDAGALRATVERALNLRVMLDDPGLKQLVSRTHSLPSIPSVYAKLMKAVQSPEVTPKEIGQIISQDLAMSAKVLQLVNSAFFGAQRRISNPADAVIYLGIETVRALAVTVSVFSQFDTQQVPRFSLQAVRDHSLAVAALARRIAESLHLPRPSVEDAFLGGLLHELGKLVLACNYPQQYSQALLRTEKEGIPLQQAEREVFGTTHAQVGAYLLWLWGLPDGVTEIVAGYDRPRPEQQQGPLVAVHVANALMDGKAEKGLDTDCLRDMGLLDQLPEWRQFRESARPQGD
jgi:HD-like signal output (HDOD) protein/CheY-like chemotaxis protein